MLHSLVDKFHRAFDCGQRDGAKVATRLPKLDVFRAKLFLAKLFKVVATGDVIEEV